ncbi:hypothetical protein SAMN05216356_11473 [Oribacterium sp. WCC10]|nr:hypothetical protein SAMN05216356_11473 [Oribacterium sp. WCC10]
MDKRIAVASILLAGVTKKMAASRFLMICRRLSLLHGVVLFYHECIEIFLKMELNY